MKCGNPDCGLDIGTLGYCPECDLEDSRPRKPRKARPTRLDKDRTAKPLTQIQAHIKVTPSGKIYPDDPDYYTVVDTDPHKR